MEKIDEVVSVTCVGLAPTLCLAVAEPEFFQMFRGGIRGLRKKSDKMWGAIVPWVMPCLLGTVPLLRGSVIA